MLVWWKLFSALKTSQGYDLIKLFEAQNKLLARVESAINFGNKLVFLARVV